MATGIVRIGVTAVLLAASVLPATAQPPFGYPPPWAAGAPESAPALRLERRADADNYYLTIHVQGMSPAAVNVSAAGGRWLAISSGGADRTTRADAAPDGSGWSRSFQYSTNQATRRISLPRDADAAAMKREDKDDAVVITIPRAHR